MERKAQGKDTRMTLKSKNIPKRQQSFNTPANGGFGKCALSICMRSAFVAGLKPSLPDVITRSPALKRFGVVIARLVKQCPKTPGSE